MEDDRRTAITVNAMIDQLVNARGRLGGDAPVLAVVDGAMVPVLRVDTADCPHCTQEYIKVQGDF